MKMHATSVAPWFGGKRQLAREIIHELGPHRHYWELFCGGLAIVMKKPRSEEETVNDLNGHLTNLAMVLASDRCPDLYERLTRTLNCEGIFKAAKRRFLDSIEDPPADPSRVTDDHLERAYWYFIVSWMGMQGVAGTARSNYQYAVRYTTTKGGGSLRFTNAVRSIPRWHERLRGIQILSRDAFTILDRIDDEPGAVIYLDPPYLRETRGDGGGCIYHHDFSGLDHVRLARAVQRFRRVRVVVSYYDHPALDDLYPGWTKRSLAAKKTVKVQWKGGVAKSTPEVLLINGPSRAYSLFNQEAATC